MSFDRFMAITRPLTSNCAHALRKTGVAALISFFTWLVSISLAGPIYLYSYVSKCLRCEYNFPLTDEEICARVSISKSVKSVKTIDVHSISIVYTPHYSVRVWVCEAVELDQFYRYEPDPNPMPVSGQFKVRFDSDNQALIAGLGHVINIGNGIRVEGNSTRLNIFKFK